MEDAALRLTRVALAQTHRAGVRAVIQELAVTFAAEGCMLWQLAPDEKRLVVVAEWFPAKMGWSVHALPIASATGEAVTTGMVVVVADTKAHPNVHHDDFLDRNGLGVFVSIPVKLDENQPAALNIYRRAGAAFSAQEVERLRRFADVVPALLNMIQDRALRGLLETVNEILSDAEREGPGEGPKGPQALGVAERVCRAVAETFQCLEVSLFLATESETSGPFELLATTQRRPGMTTSYGREPADGLVPWVIANRAPLAILDLANFDDDQAALLPRYPGLRWKKLPNVLQPFRDALDVGEGKTPPPLGFMSTPVERGEQLLGVLRCAAAQKSPYYFSRDDLRTLALVSSQVARWWTSWRSRWSIEEENRSWRTLMENLGRLNAFVYDDLSSAKPDEHRILERALEITGGVVSGAEIMDVRLLTEDGKALHFAATAGGAWKEGSPEEIHLRTSRTFRLDERSAGAWVYANGRPKVIDDVQADPDYSGTFPHVKRMIVVPIGLGDKRFGVLDIRSTRDQRFQPYAVIAAQLLGQQLGLYQHLAVTLGKAKEAESARDRDAASQRLTFQDLKHQLKSPIIQAEAVVQDLLRNVVDGSELQRRLFVVRGLCRRTKRVTMSTGLFADLESGKPIRARLAPLSEGELTKILIEAAKDHELLAQARRIRFSLDVPSQHAFLTELRLDVGLLEQALGNVLDNAAKYSFEKTRVRIWYGTTTTGRFHISVANSGFVLTSDDARQAHERGWRSDAARDTTGEGSGIGLWIVNHLMLAHQGELIVLPTRDGQTEVKLIFPAPERRTESR